jgi:DamX protein
MQSQILPSRAALVDRIALQFEYGQNLISLVGQSGLGKSYLAETLITEKYPEFNKAFITVTAKMSDPALMTELLQHSFRAPLVDQTLTLTENFYQLFKQQPCSSCLWVLDGAKHLSDEMLEQFKILAKTSPVALYILVTAQTPNMVPDALDIHLERLSLSESKQLLAMYFKDLPMDEDPLFQSFLSEAYGNPAILLSWEASKQVQLRNSQFKKNHLWQFVAMIVLVAILLIALIYNKQISLFVKEFDSNDSAALDTVLATKMVLNSNKADQDNVDSVAKKKNDLNASNMLNTKRPSLFSNEISTEYLSDNPILTSDTVPAVLSALETEVIISDSSEKESNLPSSHSEIISDKSFDEQEKTKDLLPSLRDETVSIAENEAVVERATNKILELDLKPTEWLLTQSDSIWAIQLLAVKDKAIANNFVLANELQNIYVYETVREGRPWWVVIQAPFANIDEAKRAKKRLPANIQASKPFFKKFKRIKQEIGFVTR